MTSIRPQKLSDQVVRILASRVVNGQYAAGSQAPSEKEIGDEFTVSKTVAREVMATLASMGLLFIQHGRRPLVRAEDAWDTFDPLILELREEPATVTRVLAQLSEVRELLEPGIAARAAVRATREHRLRLAEVLDAMDDLKDDPDRFLDLDIAFHALLAEAAGNDVAVHVLDSVQGLLRASRRITNALPNALVMAIAEHRAIGEAVGRGDATTAEAAMRSHIVARATVWTEAHEPEAQRQQARP